jgi:signal peptidase I
MTSRASWPGTTQLGLCAVMLGAPVVLLRWSHIVITVTGPSMSPAFEPGDQVLLRRRPAGRIRRGTVIVLREPSPHQMWTGLPAVAGRTAGRVGRTSWVIKRVAAAPGDPVPSTVRQAAGGAAVVPPRTFVVLGDNSAQSADSRQWGFVPTHQVLGVAIRRIRSLPAQGSR